MSRIAKVYTDGMVLRGVRNPNQVITGFARLYQYLQARPSIVRVSYSGHVFDPTAVRITPFDMAAPNNWYSMDYHGKGVFSFQREPPEPDTEVLKEEHRLLVATLETLIGQEIEGLFREQNILFYGAPKPGEPITLWRFGDDGVFVPAKIRRPQGMAGTGRPSYTP